MVVRGGETPFSTSFSPQSFDRNSFVGPSSSASSTLAKRYECLVKKWRLPVTLNIAMASLNKRLTLQVDRENQGDILGGMDP